MHAPIRIAVVGVGRMGRFHADTLASSEAVRLVAVADLDLDAAQAEAARLGVDAVEPVDLPRRDDIDGWIIATSTPSHPAVVESALEAGVDVLCEKPLSLDLAATHALGARATEAGRVLQVGFWRRFSPPWAAAKRLIERGVIGRPVMLRLSQWDAQPPPPAFCDPTVSGGLAIDCGVHEFDLAEWLTGARVESVQAHNLRVIDPGVEQSGDVDNMVATLHLSGEVVATVDLSRNCRYGDDVRTEVLGEDGAIFVETLPRGVTRLATGSGVEIVSGSQVDDAMASGVSGQAAAFATLVQGQPLDHPGAPASARAVAVGRAVQQAAERDSIVAVAP